MKTIKESFDFRNGSCLSDLELKNCREDVLKELNDNKEAQYMMYMTGNCLTLAVRCKILGKDEIQIYQTEGYVKYKVEE